jgi:CRISPR/Cas system CSM-associated protein Csm3 (group 7 of RAMP superfamily)
MRYRGRQPLEPNPFAYVNIHSGIEKSEYLAQDRFFEGKFTGKLEIELRVSSEYLFVGSGNYNLREKDKLVYYSFFRTNGKIVIPGTSTKGAVRSVLEAISNSCVSQAGRRENYTHTHKKCEFKPEKEKVALCRACKLFGTTGYAGRANFSDALPERIDIEIEKIHELFPPKKNKGKRKFYQNKKFNPVGNRRPEKNYRFVEAVKKESIFQTYLSFQNLTKEELALLFYAMGIDQDYRIKVGGAKPRCFGTVRFIPINLKLWTDPLEKAKEQSGEGLKIFTSEVLACDNLVVPELLNQFREEISKPDELCPKGAY